MITAIVNFQLPADIAPETVAQAFEASAPNYEGVAGLVRKYYLFDPETKIAGGVYLWDSRAAAEALYTAEWRASIEERFGAAPAIRFFDTPVIVDNAATTAQAAE